MCPIIITVNGGIEIMNNGMNYDPMCSISSNRPKGSSSDTSLVAVVDLNLGCFLVFYRNEWMVASYN